MENSFVCARCGNSDQKYIGYLHGKPYCRFCISMNGKTATKQKKKGGTVSLKLSYQLSEEQNDLSNKILENYKQNKDTLVNAVCGAGKTELVYQVIAYCLSLGKSVAFAVPRRDVVIELWHRIKDAFPSNFITAVYGGHTDRLHGDVVVLTTHQFYRYEKYFDLIILDEIDAFPFKENKLLGAMFERAKNGNVVLMSATPSESIISYFSRKNRVILELNTRFHKHPLPVPIVKKYPGFTKYFCIFRKLQEYIKLNKKVFVFAPTIEKCEKLYKVISLFFKKGEFVHSKRKNRTQIISKFKNGEFDYLVTTSVLERGVTFKDLQVIIFDADNQIYTSETLIQIAGRVGRKYDAPEGEVIYLVNKQTDEIKKSIRTIEKKNESLQSLLQTNKRD